MCTSDQANRDDELQGLPKGTCPGCPFNDGATFEASEAQNMGCLPSRGDIIRINRESGQRWACHDDESKVCAGLCHAAKDADLDLSQGGLVRYSSWYRAGEEAAIHEARTGILIQPLTGRYFDIAVEGYRYPSGQLEPRTHHVPQLKYWYPRPALAALLASNRGEQDTRVFFTASTAPERDPETGHPLRRFIGLVELECSGTSTTTIGLKYVTVHPDYRRRGVAAQMLTLMAEHLAKTGQHLQRSFASSESPPELQAHIDRVLEQYGVTWSQARRQP